MPAAAVIPAPIVYIKVAAVKKLVVGLRRSLECCLVWSFLSLRQVRSPDDFLATAFTMVYHDLSWFVLGVGLLFSGNMGCSFLVWWQHQIKVGAHILFQIVYFEKIRVFKAGVTWRHE